MMKSEKFRVEQEVIIVVLRRPDLNRKDEMRTDPFWEFGSFGCTGCHKRNLMNPEKIHYLKGARLAFAQGGREGFKLVYLSAPIKEAINHEKFAEVKWLPATMPLKYVQAPLLIDNTGKSHFSLLKNSIKDARRRTWEGRFASKFRTRREPLEARIADEVIEVFEQSNNPDAISMCYVDALPYPPTEIDHNRKQTYLRMKQKGGS